MKELIPVFIIAAAVFLICFLVDKLFTKLFRGRQEHKSGQSVRLKKRYVTIGLIAGLLGVTALLTGGWLLITGGCLLFLIGLGLIVCYMTFGIFYDSDTFIVTVFGKKSVTYKYNQIKSQQLFTSYGNSVVELHMSDGRNVQLQSSMDGMYAFLDYASAAWMRQTGREQEDCAFYDPQNSCWFPPVED